MHSEPAIHCAQLLLQTMSKCLQNVETPVGQRSGSVPGQHVEQSRTGGLVEVAA